MSEADYRAYLARMGHALPSRGPQKAQQTAQGVRAGEKAEQALCRWLDILGIGYAEQYMWGAALNPPRKFQSDLAIPAAHLLIEVDGGVHGVHDKRARDLERQNLGVLAGWQFLRFLPDQAISGEASLFIQKYLESRRVIE
ncbi:DUF559 domain-containing protein [Deinococcus humi]|uniref:Very-short-patch-repair endonuclease n=1 Tax=Deinococcus humi TaxID=662880 RepID=A0A7W8NEV3_9DEIO|nr:DUF559 domain-containing protein [Deinococcus humi]MBB5361352.1 very-short-patch-repair endonuclease [Deinococcus humi]